MLRREHSALKVDLIDNLHRLNTVGQTVELHENEVGSEQDVLEFAGNCQIYLIFMRVPELFCFWNSVLRAEIIVFRVVPQGMLFIITVSL